MEMNLFGCDDTCLVQVNGAAYNRYMQATGVNTPEAGQTSWRKICRICDARVLGNEYARAFPFF